MVVGELNQGGNCRNAHVTEQRPGPEVRRPLDLGGALFGTLNPDGLPACFRRQKGGGAGCRNIPGSQFKVERFRQIRFRQHLDPDRPHASRIHSYDDGPWRCHCGSLRDPFQMRRILATEHANSWAPFPSGSSVRRQSDSRRAIRGHGCVKPSGTPGGHSFRNRF